MSDDEPFPLPFNERLILATEAILMRADEQNGLVSDPEISAIALYWTYANTLCDDFIRLRDALLDAVGGPLIE
jgi:hypothetical protein